MIKQLSVYELIEELERIKEAGQKGPEMRQNLEAQIATKLIRRIKTEGIWFPWTPLYRKEGQ